MSREITVPDIGDFDEVEVIEILVNPGDSVVEETPLITLESDKATMDIPSPAKGTIEKILVSAGDKVAQGTVIGMLLEATTEDIDEPSGAEITEPEVDESNLKNRKPKNVTISKNTKPIEESVRSDLPILPPPAERSGNALAHASPGVRRFARELGAPLNVVSGSGPKGRILKSDIIAYVKNSLTQSQASTPNAPLTNGIPPIPDIDFRQFGTVETVDTPRIKKLSGAHLHRAWINIPHVTHHDEADITELEAFRKKINQEQQKSTAPVKVTLLAIAMKALTHAMKAFPLFNCSLVSGGERLTFKHYFNIGIAIDTPNGLMVPVFRDVDKKGILELASEMTETSTRARNGKLKSADLQGGCMSISSLGGIGGVGFTPIVNTPEVAILGLSRAKMQPVWNGQEFQPRLILPMSLSYDHRVIDGAEAARFSSWLGNALSDTRRLLL